jgi:hypothetical protein
MHNIERFGYGNGAFLTIALLLTFCIASASLYSQGRLRVFVSDSSSWEMTGGFGGSHDGMGGVYKGGARPQTAEIIKTFGERCPTVTITSARERADFVVLLDHEGGKNLILRDNKVVIYNKEADVIYSSSTRSLGNAVKDACSAIMRPPAGNP